MDLRLDGSTSVKMSLFTMYVCNVCMTVFWNSNFSPIFLEFHINVPPRGTFFLLGISFVMGNSK